MSLLLLRPAVFVVLVHGFILICAIMYSKLESKTTHGGSLPTLTYLTTVVQNGTLRTPFQNSSEKGFRDFVASYNSAYNSEVKRNMSAAFSDLTKAYFFSLTTVSTVGNSGMFLQNAASKDFYIFCIIAGIVLYVTAIHHIAVLLLPVLKYACQIQNEKKQMTGEYSKGSVLAFSYGMLAMSILLLGVSAIFAGHSYIFGLYASFDTVLTIGNTKWIAYLMDWNKEAFVVGLDLFMFLGHSLLYTTTYITIYFVKASDMMTYIDRWACFSGFSNSYKPLKQDDEEDVMETTNDELSANSTSSIR